MILDSDFYFWVLAFILASSTVILIISFVVLSFTLDKRLKNEFQHSFEKYGRDRWLLRIGVYSSNVVFRQRSFKSHYTQSKYPDFDFREFATPVERFFCFAALGSFFCFVTVCWIHVIADWLGYIEID